MHHVLGHSFVENLRRLCEDEGESHKWEDPSNARGKVSVSMHGYPGGTVKRLTAAVEAGLFVHYNPHVVICQIGGNDCSNRYFDSEAFESDVDNFIAACHKWNVALIFMSVLKRTNPRSCSPDEYIKRQKIANGILKNKSVQHYFVDFFKPINVYRTEYEDWDGVHFTKEGYRAFLVALRKALSWFINKIKPTDG